MKWYAHIASTLALALVLTPYSVAYAAAASILPDVVEKLLGLPHRSIYMHNYALPLLLSPMFFYPSLAGIPLGVLDHIVLDNLTVHGVYLFERRIRGFMNTNNPLHNMIAVAASILLAYMLS